MDPTHPWYPAYLPTVSVWTLFSWHCPFKSSFIIEISSLIFSQQLRKCYNLFLFLTDRSRDKASRVGSVSRIRTGGRCGHSATSICFILVLNCVYIYVDKTPPPPLFSPPIRQFFPSHGETFYNSTCLCGKKSNKFLQENCFPSQLCENFTISSNAFAHRERKRKRIRQNTLLSSNGIYS